MDKQVEAKKIISLKIAKKIILSLILVIVFDFFLFPAPILASEYSQSQAKNADNQIIGVTLQENNNLNGFINTLPENNNWQAVKTGYYTLTAYNSESGQCDNTPCITANGFDLCRHGQEDSVAANFCLLALKLGFLIFLETRFLWLETE